MSKENRLLYSEDIKEVILMEKRYIDNDIRGQRSEYPDKICLLYTSPSPRDS